MSYDEIRGDHGELVARLFGLLNAESSTWPSRWYDLTIMVSNWLGGPLPDRDAGPDEVDRDAFINAVRIRVDEFLAADVSEAFLIRSLLHEIDRFMDRHADIAASKDEGERFRDSIIRAVEDPGHRERYRRCLEEIDPERWSHMSDEEFVDHLMKTSEEHPLVQDPSAEEATSRWARLDQWQKDKESILGDEVIARWIDLSIARGMP